MEDYIIGRSVYVEDFKENEYSLSFLGKIYSDAKFNHIELFSAAYNKISVNDYNKLKFFIIDTNLGLAFHPWLDVSVLTFSEAVIQLKQIIRDCEKIGIGYCILHPGSYGDDRYENLQHLTEVLTEVLVEADHVKICIENVPERLEFEDKILLGSRAEDFEFIFNKIKNGNLGLNIDVGHANLTNSFNELINRFSDKIICTHLSDNNGVRDDHLMLGTGMIDWEEVFKTFKDINFKGPYVLELKSELIEGSYEYLKKILEK